MARRPSVTSVRSKQNAVLRYVVSTDTDKAAKDLGVSTGSLKRFLSASPETVKKNPTSYGLLKAEPVQTAKSKDVKLVPKLSGKRLGKAYKQYGENERATRSIRYAQATRRKSKMVIGNETRYVTLDPTKGKAARKQILENMGGTSAVAIMTQFERGTISGGEARNMLRKLWRNSGVAESKADDYFAENAG